MQNAAIRLLGLTVVDIRKQAEEIIFGQLRQVIASMRIEDINRDREKFLQNIQNSLEPELKKIGLVLINVNITDIQDETGYIEAIGQKAASQAMQQARADVAEQEKQGEIRVAGAERDKVVQVANATKQREIGTREASREQAVRIAELEKEQKVGEQTAAFRARCVGEAGGAAKRIAIAEANAKAVDRRELAQAEGRPVAGDAARAKAEAISSAKAASARPRRRSWKLRTGRWPRRRWPRPSASRRSSGPIRGAGEGEKARIIVDAEAEAEKRRLEAQGEASAIYAKLEAEARGQYEILAKKGEGLKLIVEACGGAQQAFQLLMLEHLDKLAETGAKAITNIKFDKVVVWENGGADGRSNTADFLHKMAGSMPPMMQVMRDIGGIDIPTSLATLAGAESITAKDNGHANGAAVATVPEDGSSTADYKVAVVVEVTGWRICARAKRSTQDGSAIYRSSWRNRRRIGRFCGERQFGEARFGEPVELILHRAR